MLIPQVAKINLSEKDSLTNFVSKIIKWGEAAMSDIEAFGASCWSHMFVFLSKFPWANIGDICLGAAQIKAKWAILSA